MPGMLLRGRRRRLVRLGIRLCLLVTRLRVMRGRRRLMRRMLLGRRLRRRGRR